MLVLGYDLEGLRIDLISRVIDFFRVFILVERVHSVFLDDFNLAYKLVYFLQQLLAAVVQRDLVVVVL